VTPEQRRLVLSLVVVPGGGRQNRASADELLAAFAAEDGRQLCGSLLEKALTERSEDISRILEQLGGAEVVDDLEFLAWAGPEFQYYEGSTSLAKKAVHSLERIATPAARAALTRLRRHPEEEVRDLVQRVDTRLDR